MCLNKVLSCRILLLLCRPKKFTNTSKVQGRTDRRVLAVQQPPGFRRFVHKAGVKQKKKRDVKRVQSVNLLKMLGKLTNEIKFVGKSSCLTDATVWVHVTFPTLKQRL